MPLNVTPSERGNVQVHAGDPPRGDVLASDALRVARERGLTLYLSHHATCPQGNEWKR